MADYEVSAHTKLTGGGVDFQAMIARSKVWLWDCGPPKPTMPVRPPAPKGNDGEPAYDLAMIEFRDAIVDYETALKTYRTLKTEHDKFKADYGGPYEREFHSDDATDALTNDAAAVKAGLQAALRWFISSRNHGWGHLKNNGLPHGMKPGHGQAELKRREAEGE